MKPRPLECIDCGATRISASKAIRCSKCSHIYANEKSRSRIRSVLKTLGCVDLIDVPATANSKFSISYTHEACGTRQTWTGSNLTKRLDAEPDLAPCSSCGGKRRAAIGSAAYIAKYGITEEQLVEFERYSKKVRTISDANYLKFKSTVNPLNLDRGMYTYHLDHITPIIEGFRQGLSVESMAAVENLQMLPASVNLSKGDKHVDISRNA